MYFNGKTEFSSLLNYFSPIVYRLSRKYVEFFVSRNKKQNILNAKVFQLILIRYIKSTDHRWRLLIDNSLDHCIVERPLLLHINETLLYKPPHRKQQSYTWKLKQKISYRSSPIATHYKTQQRNLFFFSLATFHTRLTLIDWSHKMRKDEMHSTEYNSNYEQKLDRIECNYTLQFFGARKKTRRERRREIICNFYSLMIFDLSPNARLIPGYRQTTGRC